MKVSFLGNFSALSLPGEFSYFSGHSKFSTEQELWTVNPSGGSWTLRRSELCLSSQTVRITLVVAHKNHLHFPLRVGGVFSISVISRRAKIHQTSRRDLLFLSPSPYREILLFLPVSLPQAKGIDFLGNALGIGHKRIYLRRKDASSVKL